MIRVSKATMRRRDLSTRCFQCRLIVAALGIQDGCSDSWSQFATSRRQGPPPPHRVQITCSAGNCVIKKDTKKRKIEMKGGAPKGPRVVGIEPRVRWPSMTRILNGAHASALNVRGRGDTLLLLLLLLGFGGSEQELAKLRNRQQERGCDVSKIRLSP